MEFGRLDFRDLVGAVHAQHQPIGPPPSTDIHHAGEDERHHQTGLTSEHLSRPKHEGGERGKEYQGLEAVHRTSVGCEGARGNLSRRS
jgi:hypothetical protein